MAVPVITVPLAQFVAQGGAINFTPVATGSSITWTFATLPTGVSGNSSSGALTGTLSTLGHFVCKITATNGDGSDYVYIPIIVYTAVVSVSSAATFPYYLSAANTVYRLTEDITVPGTAFGVTGLNACLDLNSKTLTYDNFRDQTIVNGDFATGDSSGWDFTNAPGAAVQALSYINGTLGSGTYSLHLTIPGNTTHTIRTSAALTLTAGREYCVNMWHNKGTSQVINMRFLGTSLSKNAFQTPSNRLGAVGEWIFTSPTTVSGKLEIDVVNSSGSTAHVYLDRIKLDGSRIHGVALPSSQTPTLTGTRSTGFALVNGTVIQGAGANYNCAVLHHSFSAGLILHKVTLENHANATLGDNGSPLWMNYTNGCHVVNTIIRNKARFILNRDNFWGYSARCTGAEGLRIWDNNTFDQSPQGGIYLVTVGGTQPFIFTRNRFQLTSKYSNGFAFSCKDDGALDIAGNQLTDNVADYTLDPTWGSRGFHFGRGRNYTLSGNSLTLTEQANNQEYGGVVLGGAYCLQLETSSTGGNITIDGDYYKIFGTSDGACIRINAEPLTGAVTISHCTLIVDCESSVNTGKVIKCGSSTLSDYTIENCDITTNSILLNFGQDNVNSLLIKDCSITYINDGLGLYPYELGFHGSGIAEIRSPTYANVATKNWLKQRGDGTGNDPVALSVLYTHDCDLTFSLNAVAQAGLDISIEWIGQSEVFSGTTNGAGKVFPNLVEFECDLVEATSHTPHFITTDYPSYHSLTLTDTTRTSVFDVVDDDVGPDGPDVDIAYGSSANAVNGSNSLSIPYPAIVNEEDILIVSIANKLSANPPTTPSGWTAITATGGYGVAGQDTGTVRITVLYKQADGSETGNLVVTIPSGNSSYGRMIRWTKDGGQEWSMPLANTSGSINSSVGTAWSVTGAANPGITAGDVMLAISAISTDDFTYSAQAMTATGISAWGTVVERNDQGTTTGNDVGLVISEHPVTTGTASAAPVFTMTASNSNVNGPAGATIFLRLRQETVTSVPVITSHPGPTATIEVQENNSLVAAFTVTGSPSPTPALSGTDNAKFAMVGNQLRWVTAPDFETPTDANADGNYLVRVTYTNASGSDFVDLTVTVTEVNEAPTGITLSNDDIASGTDTTGGYSVGTLTTTGDPDAGDTHTYSIVDGDDASVFSIGGVGDDELLIDDGVVNFFDQETYNVVVRTTDEGGLTFDQEYTINIGQVDVIEFSPLTITYEFGPFTIEGGLPAVTDNAVHYTMDAPMDGPEFKPAVTLQSAGGDYRDVDRDKALTTAVWGSPLADLIDSESDHHGTLVVLDTLLAWQDPGLEFDDPAGYATIPDFAHSRTTFSVSAWLKTSASGVQCVIGQGGTAGTLSWLVLVANGLLQARLSENGTDVQLQYTGTTDIADGEWHHVAVTWNAGSLKLYVDGVQEPVQIDIDEQITEIRESVSPIVIGAFISGASISLNFTGVAKQVAIYNKTLSDDNVEQIAEDVEEYVTDRLAYYKMDYSPSRGTVIMPPPSAVQLGYIHGPNGSLVGTLIADLPDDPLYSILVFRARDADGQPLAGISVNVRVVKAPLGQGTLFSNATITKVTDSDGYARFTVPKGSDLKYWINEQWKNLDDVGLTDDIVYVDNWIGHA